jgi:hypothetical protein
LFDENIQRAGGRLDLQKDSRHGGVVSVITRNRGDVWPEIRLRDA